jgi:hypothetical protein
MRRRPLLRLVLLRLRFLALLLLPSTQWHLLRL